MSNRRIHIISVSGGKDSTTTALLAIERFPDVKLVFADTGNEHQITYDYVDYLENCFGRAIHRLRADFSTEIAAKRMFIARDVRTGRKDGRRIRWSNKAKRRALAILHPTGNPYLDLCLIYNVVEWASTSRGGLQFNLPLDQPFECSSAYGLCE